MGKRKRYTSDLTDGEWERIKLLLPDEKPVGRTREVKMSSEFGVISSELLGIGLYLSPILGRPRMARLVPYLIPNSEFRIRNSVNLRDILDALFNPCR